MAASFSTRTMSVPRPAMKRASQTWPGMSPNHFEDFLREIGANTESAHLCCVPRGSTHPEHSPSVAMASSSPHLPRPAIKRASQTWPGIATSRNHFEDFIREIGANAESTHLCCVPRNATIQPHVHTHKRSASKARTSPTRAHDQPRASTQTESSASRPQPRPENRGRTLSSPKVSGTLTSGLPILLKSPALSSIDIENHDVTTGSYSYLSSSARDSLLTVMGDLPVEERPSRALTRTFRSHHTAVGRSPDSPAASRLRKVSRGSEERSRARSSARSASRTPSIDSVDTASSSEAPATPKSHSVLAHDLPSLEDLEQSSRFRVQSVCTMCKRAGSNFPSCAKCGEMWCSRECRTGATHVCHGRLVGA